jgi:hypothetical protein
LDRDKDLVQKTRVQETKMISGLIPSSVDVWLQLDLWLQLLKKIMNEKRLQIMILQLQLWKKRLQEKQTVLGKKISANQFCSWQIVVYALGHQVVLNNFELFCLGFILVEDCVETLNVPLHTGGKNPLKKLVQSQQNLQK